jgi:glycolate oxidase iron-sulfur subunit
MHLVDHARAYIEDTYERPWRDRLLRTVLAKILPYPARFRIAMQLAALGRPFAGTLRGNAQLRSRLRAMLALAPARLPPPGVMQSRRLHPARGERRARVALLLGCAQRVLAPSINEATISLLNRLGVEVVIPPEVGCCGALTHHMGRSAQAHATAQAAIEGFAREIDGEGLDAIIINTSGCGTTVKDYGFMFRAAAVALREMAEKVSSRAQDIAEFIAKFGYQPTRARPNLRVAYHSACSLQHGQRITDAPKMLLRKAGFIVVEPIEPHLCCGSAGTYNIMQPEIASKLRARKLENIKKTRPDVIAAGNIGCLTQLAGDGIPTIHTVELLDWMAGGNRPASLPNT